jgi:dynein light chain LC8-type
MSERKAVIKNADMSEDMQQEAIDCSTQARVLLHAQRGG